MQPHLLCLTFHVCFPVDSLAKFSTFIYCIFVHKTFILLNVVPGFLPSGVQSTRVLCCIFKIHKHVFVTIAHLCVYLYIFVYYRKHFFFAFTVQH